MKPETNAEEKENIGKYLMFYINKQLYGTPLLGVREVMEIPTIRSVPNTVQQFLGVVNIRGEIVGVTDLRLKFKRPAQQSPTMAMIVFETTSGPMAGVVDQIDSVMTIEEEHIDHSPNLSLDTPIESLIGIGKVKEQLAILLDLNQVLGIENLSYAKLSK